jgi:hypothetical protein
LKIPGGIRVTENNPGVLVKGKRQNPSLFLGACVFDFQSCPDRILYPAPFGSASRESAPSEPKPKPIKKQKTRIIPERPAKPK